MVEDLLLANKDSSHTHSTTDTHTRNEHLSTRLLRNIKTSSDLS